MKTIRWKPAVAAICTVAAGCASVSLAPGADQVTVTRRAADVAACTPVGDMSSPPPMMTDPDVDRRMRNETLSLGGNVLLITSSLRRTGTAYRCGGDATAPFVQTPAPPVTSASPAAMPAPGVTVGPAAMAAPAAMAVPSSSEIVQAQVDAFNARDLERFLSFYADDARILDYPDQVLASGKDAMRDRYRKLFQPAEQLHATIQHRTVFDRFVIDQERVTGLPDGKVTDAVAIYETKGGRIVRVTFLRP